MQIMWTLTVVWSVRTVTLHITWLALGVQFSVCGFPHGSVHIPRFSGHDAGVAERCLVPDSVAFCRGWHIFVSFVAPLFLQHRWSSGYRLKRHSSNVGGSCGTLNNWPQTADRKWSSSWYVSWKPWTPCHKYWIITITIMCVSMLTHLLPVI